MIIRDDSRLRHWLAASRTLARQPNADGRRALVAAGLPPPCVDVVSDSRRVRSGALFVAIVGMTTDGHRYLTQAQAAGAVAAIVERPDEALDLPQFVVEDSALALAEACRSFFDTAPVGLRYVGITGTNGKTTTTALAAHILNRAGLVSAAIGTNGVSHPRLETGHLAHTTPDAPKLHRLLARLIKLGSDVILIETSSHALVQGRVAAIDFEVGAFTNLSHEHLDYHHTMEDYAAAKARLFATLPARGRAVLNVDDPWSATMAEHSAAPLLACSSGGREAQVALVADSVVEGADGQRFTVRIDGADYPVELPLPGRFNIDNALIALGIAHALGVPAAEASAALADFPGSAGRMERLDEGWPCPIYLDFAHTAAALEAALRALMAAREPGGRLHLLLSVRGEREREKRAEMARVAARYADRIVVTLKDSGHEPAAQILADLEAGLGAARALEVELNRPRALRLLLAEAEPGDAVLILGLVSRDRMRVGDRDYAMDDIAACQLALTERALDLRLGTESG